MNPVFLKSAADPNHFPADTGLEIAVVGRSNSGKSSAINRMFARRKLARVSKTPGRTRLVNFFEVAPSRRLVDLPGYGFAKVADRIRSQWRQLLEAYFTERESLAGLIITIDARRGLGELDRSMLAWASQLGIAPMLLLTKADKLSRRAGLEQLRLIRHEVPAEIRVELFSAQSGEGVSAAREQVEHWLELKSAAGPGVTEE